MHGHSKGNVGHVPFNVASVASVTILVVELASKKEMMKVTGEYGQLRWLRIGDSLKVATISWDLIYICSYKNNLVPRPHETSTSIARLKTGGHHLGSRTSRVSG